MHIALVDVPAQSVRVWMVAGVADASVAGLQVLAGAVRAGAGHRGALVDVGAAVVLAGSLGAQHRVQLAALRRARLARHAPA